MLYLAILKLKYCYFDLQREWIFIIRKSCLIFKLKKNRN